MIKNITNEKKNGKAYNSEIYSHYISIKRKKVLH